MEELASVVLLSGGWCENPDVAAPMKLGWRAYNLPLHLSLNLLSTLIANAIRLYRSEVSARPTMLSFTASFNPLMKMLCKALSSHPSSVANVRNSTA